MYQSGEVEACDERDMWNVLMTSEREEEEGERMTEVGERPYF